MSFAFYEGFCKKKKEKIPVVLERWLGVRKRRDEKAKYIYRYRK